MPTIDDKVVAMSFESSKFEQGVSKSITALDKLKAALRFDHAGKGLEDVGKAANNLQLGHIGTAVDGVSRKLESLRLVAIGVLSQLSTQAIRAGATFVKSLTLDPIKLGFQEYATNLNAVQTILANTQAAGTDLKDVNAALDELNEFSDKTIYNFAQMARNIGTFTAAGVELETATGAIKGIANLAALSGSNSEQASTAMYQLSQAISAGRVSLMDWNSVVNAGMGGTVFQRALAQTAEQMGTLKKGAVDLVGPMKNVSINGESFRQSLSAAGGPGGESWLTSKVLTSTLEQFTGDLKDAELAAMGFNEEQIKAIQQTATTAMKAATEVKTLEQTFQVAKETAGSGWAQTWEIIFGDFEEAKKLFTGVSNAVNGFINASADARNKVLGDWKQLGGRTQLIESIKNIFEALGDVIAPIKEAFREFFPAKTGQDLFRLSSAFLRFTESLKPSPETVELLRRTFRGLFAVLDIGKELLGGIFGVFKDVFSTIGEGTGGFLEFTASIGDWLVKLNEAITEGEGLQEFFDGLADVIKEPIEILGVLKDALSDVFSGFSSGGVSGEMSVMSKVVEALSDAWSNFVDAFTSADKVFKVIFDSLVAGFETLGPAIGDALGNMNFDALLQVVQTGLFAGLVIMFKRFLGRGSAIDQVTKGFGGGIIKNISGTFRALEGSMVAIQRNLNAKTLKEIAIAIGIMAASVVALSFVDPDRLTSSLTAMTVAFGQLLVAMGILTAITRTTGFIKLPFIAGSLILLAGAILVLSAAVAVLAQLDWNELAKGLVGVGVLLGIISAAVIPLSANSAGMVRAGIGIAAIGVGLLILATAVKIFATMSWEEMGKGLFGVSAGLTALVVATSKIPAGGMVGIGAGLILVATSLLIMAIAVEKFGNMDWLTMGKGMFGIAAALTAIAVAMKFMPAGKTMILQAAALVLIAASLQGIVRAVSIMGGMSVEDLAKGLISLAVALGIMAGALALMSANILGAVALGITAAALALFIPQLILLGALSWKQILTGLAALAGAFILIGAAGALLAPVILPLLGFGAALLLIGAGIFLVGAGIALLGAGLSALIVALPTGVGVMLAAIIEFQEGMIKNVKLLILGLLEIVQGIADVAPDFMKAIGEILKSFLDLIIESMPSIVEAFQAILDAILQLLVDNTDDIIQAGFNLLISFLQGIRDHIGEIATVVVEIIDGLITAIADNISLIVSAGARLLVAFINGIASNIGMIVTAAGNLIVRFIGGLSSQYGRIITAGTSFIVNLITGIGNNAGRVVTAGVNAVLKFIQGLGQNAVKLARGAAQVILDFLKGLKTAVDTYAPQITEATIDIGVAIVQGIIEGVLSKADDFRDAIIDLLPGPLKKFAGMLGLESPSKLFYGFGENIVQGLVNGVRDNSQAFVGVMEDTGTSAINTMRQTLHDASNMVTDELDANPTITPILDLTQVRGQVQELTRLTDISPIAAAASLRAASAISAAQVVSEEAAVAPSGTLVNFEQNNYSPTALSESEIYRRTRNQLSQVRIALGLT